MQPAVELRPACAVDAAELVLNLRESDRQEVLAYGFADPLAPIVESIVLSDEAWAARVDGQLVCVFGIRGESTVLTSHGVPWMLGTPALARHARALNQDARAYIAAMLHRYGSLVNVVHARNTVAVRWLRRLGFTIDRAQPMGLRGEKFHQFRMT